MWHWLLGILAYLGLVAHPAVHAAPPPPPLAYVVHQTQISDEKSVFATVESAYVVPARVRTGGTILELKVRQGDHVDQGQVIALVGAVFYRVRLNDPQQSGKKHDAWIAKNHLTVA